MSQAMRTALARRTFFLAFGLCLFLAACDDSKTVWSAESRSPDGYWQASAQTKQYGGPGTAGVITSVYLARTNSSDDPIKVLEFSQETQLGTIDLQMHWLTKTHLEVTYKGHPTTDFQAIKCADVAISVRDLSV